MTHSRRSFLLLLGVPALRALARDEAAPIRVTWLSFASAPAALLAGARFGAAEAATTAALFGRHFEIAFAEVATAAAAARAARKARAAGALVVAGGIPASIAAKAAGPSAPLLLILPRGESSDSVDHAWHVRPGAAATERVLAGVRERLPQSERDSARVVAWHPSLRRYGAGELNERFVAHANASMDEEAWLGWIAVKIALESALRGHEVGAARIDGHKGKLLRFDESRTLVQPLYVAVKRNGEEVVIDA